MALTQRQRRSEKITGPKVTAPASTMVRRRIPELAVGVLLMGLFALGALVLFQDSNDPVAVAAVGTEIPAGGVITASSLVPIGITSDSLLTPDVILWDSADLNRLIRDERRAIVTLREGTLLSPSVIAPSANIRTGFRGVGHVVESEAIPDINLNASDQVDLISVRSEDPRLIVEAINVVEVQGGQGRWFVLLEVPVDHEVEVVAAIADGTLRMARLPR